MIYMLKNILEEFTMKKQLEIAISMSQSELLHYLKSEELRNPLSEQNTEMLMVLLGRKDAFPNHAMKDELLMACREMRAANREKFKNMSSAELLYLAFFKKTPEMILRANDILMKQIENTPVRQG